MNEVYKITREELEDIANSIRTKTGKIDLMTVSEMPDEISGISGGGSEERNKTVKENLGFIDLENDSRVTIPNGLTWTKSSTYKFGTEEGYNSPPIGDSQETTQELTFTPIKDGFLTVFYVCTSEDEKYDYFRLIIDGLPKVDIYSQGNTQNYIWEIFKLKCVANQTKTLALTYRKDSSNAGGYDKAGFLISFWE